MLRCLKIYYGVTFPAVVDSDADVDTERKKLDSEFFVCIVKVLDRRII